MDAGELGLVPLLKWRKAVWKRIFRRPHHFGRL